MRLWSALYKVIVVLVFGMLFFVQMQPEYFYCATKNKRPGTDITLTKTNAAGVPALLPKNKNILDNIQLNKRYQPVDFFEILPLLICIQCLLLFVSKQFLQPLLHIHDVLLTIKCLRGPPSYSL